MAEGIGASTSGVEVTDWQREMARTLVGMFNDTVPLTPDPAVSRWERERRRFEVASAMCHLLDDLVEGRACERIFYGINVPPPSEEK